MQTYPMLIESSQVRSKKLIEVINPRTEEPVGEIYEATEEQMDKALAAASNGFSVWSKMPPKERRHIILNYADILDDALTRPGRFDRHVVVPLPDIKGRKQILGTRSLSFSRFSLMRALIFVLPHVDFLGADVACCDTELYAKKTPLAKDVDLSVLARGTPGMSGAELFNLVNQAALYASVKGETAVNMKAFEYSKDKTLPINSIKS